MEGAEEAFVPLSVLSVFMFPVFEPKILPDPNTDVGGLIAELSLAVPNGLDDVPDVLPKGEGLVALEDLKRDVGVEEDDREKGLDVALSEDGGVLNEKPDTLPELVPLMLGLKPPCAVTGVLVAGDEPKAEPGKEKDAGGVGIAGIGLGWLVFDAGPRSRVGAPFKPEDFLEGLCFFSMSSR